MKASRRSTDEEFDEEFEKDRVEWERSLRPIEAAICRRGKRELDALEKAGVRRQALVTLLAIAATKDDYWKKWLRSRRDAIMGLARRMRTLAKEAKEQAADPSCRLDFWIWLRGGNHLGMPWPEPWAESDPGVAFGIAGIRTLARMWEREARLLGLYLRSFGQTDSGIVLLLLYVCIWTGRKMNFEHLVWLLTFAFEAAGNKRSFSSEALRKTFEHRVPKLLRLVRSRSQARARSMASPLAGVQIPKLSS